MGSTSCICEGIQQSIQVNDLNVTIVQTKFTQTPESYTPRRADKTDCTRDVYSKGSGIVQPNFSSDSSASKTSRDGNAPIPPTVKVTAFRFGDGTCKKCLSHPAYHSRVGNCSADGSRRQHNWQQLIKLRLIFGSSQPLPIKRTYALAVRTPRLHHAH